MIPAAITTIVGIVLFLLGVVVGMGEPDPNPTSGKHRNRRPYIEQLKLWRLSWPQTKPKSEESSDGSPTGLDPSNSPDSSAAPNQPPPFGDASRFSPQKQSPWEEPAR